MPTSTTKTSKRTATTEQAPQSETLNSQQHNVPWWAGLAASFQDAFLQSLDMANLKQAGSTSALPQISVPFQELQSIQANYLSELTEIFQQGVSITPPADDRRFATKAWQDSPWSASAAAIYALNCKTLRTLANKVEADEKTRNRLHFSIDQWAAAASPANIFALNPDAQQKAIETKGESLRLGLLNMLEDLQRGQMTMTDESQFELGKNLACTEGAVIFHNEFLEVIQYTPLTGKVHQRPILLIPPSINKFYIMDLQPKNSLVRYLLSEGLQVFMVSWKNPIDSLQTATWDDYLDKGLIPAIAAVKSITHMDRINALGFCIGGTLLATLMSILAQRKDNSIASGTLLTTLLDFDNTGILDVFVDERSVEMREQTLGKCGLLNGKELASTFSFLRPNELVWNYVVGNYLKGETPTAFDILYWNSDPTNLPGPFYTWYLRNAYLENNFAKPGKLTICGTPLDLSAIHAPLFIYGSKEDHIVPINASYASTQMVSGKTTYVMGASGHVAGVINPPAAHKRCYWVRPDDQLPATWELWEAEATEHAGSWWPLWSTWLKKHALKLVDAPTSLGNTKYPQLENAPGSYVRVRI